MRYQLLGKSGLRVSEVCLGTMTFGETWGWGAAKEECQKMVDLFAEAGGNFIDTSINYTNGTSEILLGELLHGRRDQFVLATKYTLTKPDDADPNGGGNSRKNMMKSVERSLKHLQTDYIDLYYLHAWDFMTPVEEVLRGLDDLVRMGKVLYIAISDTPDWIVAEANAIAELRGWSRFIGLQVPYSLLDRAVERALLPMAGHWDMAVMPWGLLNAGILSGKFLKQMGDSNRQGDDNRLGDNNRAGDNRQVDQTRLNPQELKLSEKAMAVVAEVQKIAEATGRSMAQVAINWARQNPVAQIIPILGARKVEQLKDNLGVVDWRLTDEQMKSLNDVSAIDLGFPHGFLDGNPYVFGATFDKIDNHRR